MPIYEYVIKSNCSDTTYDHYHSAALSDINNALRNNIPNYAWIYNAKVYLKMDHDSVLGTLGNADVNIWFSNNGDDNSGKKILSGTTSVNPKVFEEDITSYVSNIYYPFTISCSSYSRLAVYYDSTTRRKYNCNVFKVVVEYRIPSYIIQVNATEGGTASCNIDIRDYLQHGTQAVITATPNTGYKFVKWSDGNTSATRTITVTSNATYTAVFEKNTVTATFKNYDNSVLQTISVDYGSTPTYTGSTPTKSSTAEYDYKFSGWSPTPSAVTSDVTYIAQFIAEKRKYTLNVNAAEGGTVTGGGSYEYGSTVTLTASANAGYEFVKWSDGNISPSRAVTVTENLTFTAYFRTNRLLGHTSSAKKVLLNFDEVKALLLHNTKIYEKIT